MSAGSNDLLKCIVHIVHNYWSICENFISSVIRIDRMELSATALSSEAEVVCYSCQEGGPDGSGHLPGRSCACRGSDAGYVHLSCLANYASEKSRHEQCLEDFKKPWEYCPVCEQKHRGEFAVALATEFSAFVRREYPHDATLRVICLSTQLSALMGLTSQSTPRQMTEIGVIARLLLEMVPLVSTTVDKELFLSIKGIAHHALGTMARREVTAEGDKRMIAHFQNYLEVNEELGYCEGINFARVLLADARSMCGGVDIKEYLSVHLEAYESRVIEFGEEGELTIHAGTRYAELLLKFSDPRYAETALGCERQREALDLLSKMKAISVRVFGTDHPVTKVISRVFGENELVE